MVFVVVMGVIVRVVVMMGVWGGMLWGGKGEGVHMPK